MVGRRGTVLGGLLFVLVASRRSRGVASFPVYHHHHPFGWNGSDTTKNSRVVVVVARAAMKMNTNTPPSDDPRATAAEPSHNNSDEGLCFSAPPIPLFSSSPSCASSSYYTKVVDARGAHAVERRGYPNDNDASTNRKRAMTMIRLENQVDPTLLGEAGVQRQDDVWARTQEVKARQAAYGPPTAQLGDRRWKYLATGDLNGLAAVDDDDAEESAVGSSFFTALQFNTLAEGLSAGPDVPRPFSSSVDQDESWAASCTESEKAVYGGFSDVAHPEIVLDFGLRRWRVLEVILGKDRSCPYDLLGLEEVDRFYGFFYPLLRLFGYQGTFVPKPRSPSVRMGWYSDGCCLLWKKSKFDFVSEKKIEYTVGSQVLLMAWLKHKPTDQLVLVCVTHLKAQRSPANEKIRCAQVRELVTHIRDELATASSTNAAAKEFRIPVVVLGDFNADVPSQTGCDESAIRDLLHSNISPHDDVPYSLESAYDISPPETNFYTTWKTRGPTTTKRIIDYIFFGGNLSCRANLALPEVPPDAREAKLPSLCHPSDHMAIAALFDLGR